MPTLLKTTYVQYVIELCIYAENYKIDDHQTSSRQNRAEVNLHLEAPMGEILQSSESTVLLMFSIYQTASKRYQP